jgi:outer membrane receptor protein involved in Fe transport
MILSILLSLGLHYQVDTTQLSAELEEVTIRTTFRKESVGSLNLQSKTSVNMIDGMSSEIIKKSPDRNLGETLKRIGGITIQGDRFVIVRGLNDRYNSVLLNGALLSSTEPDRRAFSFDIIPNNVVESMTISKTASPNIPNDFGGGLIQIVTKNEFIDIGHNIGFGIGYGSLSTFQPSQYVKFTDLPNLFPTTKEYRTSSLEQRRYFTSLIPTTFEIQDRTNPMNLNLNYSVVDRVRLKNGGFGFVGNVIYRNSNSITYSNRKDYQSETDLAYNYNDRVNTNTQNLSVMFNPTVMFSDKKFTIKNLFNYQGENLFIHRTGENYDNLQELNYTNSIGFRKYILTSQFEKTKGNKTFGVNYFWMNRNQPDYRITPLARSLGSQDSMTFVWRDTYRFWARMNEHGLGTHYHVSGKKLNWGIVEQVKYRVFDARVFRYTDKITLNEITNNTDRYLGGCNLLSGYLMYSSKLGRLNYNGGVRNENQNFIVNTADFSGREVTVFRNYFDFLPSLNLNYNLTENNNLRFSASQTVARPEFREVSNFSFYDFVRNAQVVGNPNLQKTKITNFDLRFESFFTPTENFSTSLFLKHFDSPIEQIVANGSSPSNLILTYSNPQNSKLFGAEMELRKKVTNLLTFYTNLSYIKSAVEVNGIIRPLQGQSPYIINSGVFYTKKNISVSLFYNRIGERISAVGFNGYSDIYENGRDLVDATVQYKTKKMEFKVVLTDLLSQGTILYQKVPNRNLINTINEKSISISLNYKL